MNERVKKSHTFLAHNEKIIIILIAVIARSIFYLSHHFSHADFIVATRMSEDSMTGELNACNFA